MNWRDKLDSAIKMHLEKQIAESMKDKESYESAPIPGNAQMWIAIANLSKEAFDLNLRIKHLEKALVDISAKKNNVKNSVGKKKVIKENKLSNKVE